MPILFFSVVSRYLPRLIGLSLPILKIATWLKFPFFFYMSRVVLLSPSLQMVAPTYSSYYSQGIYSENLFPHFPLHPWEAISNSSPYYSFIRHRPSSYEIDNKQGLARRCWRNCCQRLRARRRRRQPPLRYPRWIGSMRFGIPVAPNSLLVSPVLVFLIFTFVVLVFLQ